MSIGFNQIQIDLRVPGQYIEFDNSGALQGLPLPLHKILVLGQRLATGSVAQAVPVLVTSPAQAEAYFGRGSMLSHMFQALKKANNYTECWAIALNDNGAGASAIGTFTVTGPATAPGTIVLYIGGRRITIGVAAADAQNAIAAAINTAINANTDLPVTSGVAANVVTVTARHKGENGNYIDLRVNYYQGEQLPAGVVIAVVAMSGGTGNPVVATALAAVDDTQFHTVVMPWTDAANLTALEGELANRWGPAIMREGQAFAGMAATQSALVTFGTGRNSPFLSTMGAYGSPTPPYEWAAVLAGVDAAEPDPGRPRQTLLLPGILPPLQPNLFSFAERDILLRDGISTFYAGPDGSVYIERLITGYRVNSQGVPDRSYLDIETLRVLAFLRFSVRSRIALKYPRHKLAADGTLFGQGQKVVTPSAIRAELCALFHLWEDAGLVEGFAQFKKELVVIRSATDMDRVDAIIPPDVINQFRVFAAQVQFRL